MKFVPFRLFRFLHPVDIETNIKRFSDFEETLKELTRQNSEYHEQTIQLGNQIIQLSGELEETKQELEQSKSAAKQLNANVLHLTEGLNERERQRECLFAKLEAHRDAARVIFAALVKLGHESQQTMSSKKPKG